MNPPLPRNDLHDFIRARHEQTNGRLHQWNCIASKFRHDREKHVDFFHAVAAIVQLEIMHGFAAQFNIEPVEPYVTPDTYEPNDSLENREQQY